MTRSLLILTVVFFAQAVAFYGFSRTENVPLVKPLAGFPTQLGPWQMLQQGVMEQEVKDVLKADDYIIRYYGKAGTHETADLFVAFFKSQRQGQAPHSPKNCLPGAGWVWTVSDTIPIDIPGRDRPIRVNRYIVSKGDEKALVLYWYQSRDRVVASEYVAKIYVVEDALRLNRTDTALVKVTVPVVENNEKAAMTAGVDFIQDSFQTLRTYFPN